MLRNLNRSYTMGRICGTPHVGILGSLIPSTGDDGAPPLYGDVSLPADNDNEYRMHVTSIPSGLTLFAYEDSSFTASGADGLYTVTYDLYENGTNIGSTYFRIRIGAGGVGSGSFFIIARRRGRR